MQRRTLLQLGLLSGAALTVAGGAALWFTERAWNGGQLTATGRRVLHAVGRAVLDGCLPTEAPQAEAALHAHLDRMNVALSRMPPTIQAEVNELLTILGTAAGRVGLVGLSVDWGQASVAELQAALQDMRQSSISLRQLAYQALRELTRAAYFADPGTWAQMGYPGPTPLH